MKVRTGYSGRDVRGRPTGPTWSENVPTLDLASYPQTPLERRIATPEELVQVAAVAVAWVEAIDARRRP